MNKYLTKISSDLSIAQTSKAEEDKAIQDYQKRLQDANSPELRSAIEHAMKEEKDHSERFGKVIEKVAMNRVTKHVFGIMEPTLRGMLKDAPKEAIEKGLAEFKNSVKLGIRNGTGGLPSSNSSTFKDSFKGRLLEKVAVTRLVKELSKGVVSTSLDKLVNLGALRSKSRYLKGMKVGNLSIAKEIDAKISKPKGLAASMFARKGGGYTIMPHDKTDSLIIHAHGNPVQSRKSIDHQLAIRHELYEGRAIRDKMEDKSWPTYNMKNIVKEHQNKNPSTGNKMERDAVLKFVADKNTPMPPTGKSHMSNRVLLSESRDVSKNPYLQKIKAARVGNGDAKIVEDITGRPYGEYK